MTQNADRLAADAIYKCWKELRSFIIIIVLAVTVWQIAIYVKAEGQRAEAEEAIRKAAREGQGNIWQR